MTDAPLKPSAVRRRGRTVGTAAIMTIITSFTVVCSTEVILQAWAPTPDRTTADCRPGVSALIAAVRRARGAAAEVTDGEREAVLRFRQALGPEWTARTSLGERCRHDREATSALDEVDRLRYAEEQALRYEALDVAKRRNDVEALEKRLASTR